MASAVLARVLLLIASLVVPLIYCDGATNEPLFPKLLDRTNPNRHRIHIISERLYPNGGYKAAEEFVDLELGKAAYVETSNNVRTTWLVNTKENSIHKYRPFNCSRYDHTNLIMDSPNLVGIGSTKISVGENGEMFLYGISSLLELFSVSTTKQYSRTANLIRTVGDLDGSERIGHKWSLSHGHMVIQVFFSELANKTTAAEPGKFSGLLLDSIEIKLDLKTTTINILSIEHELPHEAYNNELQLPLIYGCRRDAGTLSAEMQQKFDILANDMTIRHHLKAKARAMNFAGNEQFSTEVNIIELALSQPNDADYNISPVRVHMTRQQDAQNNIKTVVDHYLNVKYEANMATGTCTILNVGSLIPINEDQSTPIVLQFPNNLTLNFSARVLEGMLYTVTKESFMKLEQRGDSKYAYFSDTVVGVFGPGSVGNVVRRFSFGSNGRAKLDGVAIWILESSTSAREVYDFNIIESKSLASDANSAQAFDVSRECYLNSEEARYGQDFAWFELDYSLAPEQVDALRDKVEELKNTFYRLIRANLNLSYLRIPKLEVIFNGDSSGFTIKMLVLDSLPLHLIYDELEFFSLDPSLVDKSQPVDSLYDCSEFCWNHQCTGMTFSRVNNNCSVTRSRLELRSFHEDNDDVVSYKIHSEQQFQHLPREESRLRRQIEALHSQSLNESEILGFNEYNHLHRAKNLKGFGNLRAVFKLNGQLVDLAPVSARVESEPATIEPAVDLDSGKQHEVSEFE